MIAASNGRCGRPAGACSCASGNGGCLRQSVLRLLRQAGRPLTTAQIAERLALPASAPGLYSVLFALQLDGAVECFETCPWRWVADGRP